MWLVEGVRAVKLYVIDSATRRSANHRNAAWFVGPAVNVTILNAVMELSTALWSAGVGLSVLSIVVMQIDATIPVPLMDSATQGGPDMWINTMANVDCVTAAVTYVTVSKGVNHRTGDALDYTVMRATDVNNIASLQIRVLYCL